MFHYLWESIFYINYKMTLTDKVLDGKNKANKAQYNLDRETTKVSALSSSDLKNMINCSVKI